MIPRCATLAAALLILAVACDDAGNESTDAATSDRAEATGSAGCGRESPEPGRHERTRRHDGETREYRLWIPEGYDPDTPAPVTFNLHGFTSNAADQDGYTRLAQAAGERGYVTVSAQGLVRPGALGSGADGDVSAFWNATPDPAPATPDDVGFLSAVLDDLEAELCIDVDREYSAGLSNGAMMSVALGCALSDRLAAIAPVAGVHLVDCTPSSPVPMIAIHGTADSVAPYETSGTPNVVEAVGEWAVAGGCAADPVVAMPPSPDLEWRQWRGCPAGVDVELYTVLGGMHSWPGHLTPAVSLDANDVVLDFFDTHSRSTR